MLQYQVAEVIDLIVSNFPGAQYGPLHYHSLESDKTQALKINKGNYEARIQLTSGSTEEMKWWIENMPTVRRDIDTNRCFKTGWGGGGQLLAIR